MCRDYNYYPLPTENLAPDAVIIANGNFPTHRIPRAILHNAKRVVCCDGAANEYVSRGFAPEVIIGDGDSLSPELKTLYADRIHYSPDQETNDLTKAVKYCVEQRLTSVIIVGATGKREDHTIGNVSLLVDYIDLVDHIQLITDHGVFTAIQTDSTFECVAGKAVSIFNFEATSIRGHGLQYPLSVFTNWWQGTLNTATSNPFTVHSRGKVLVFREF